MVAFVNTQIIVAYVIAGVLLSAIRIYVYWPEADADAKYHYEWKSEFLKSQIEELSCYTYEQIEQARRSIPKLEGEMRRIRSPRGHSTMNRMEHLSAELNDAKRIGASPSLIIEYGECLNVIRRNGYRAFRDRVTLGQGMLMVVVWPFFVLGWLNRLLGWLFRLCINILSKPIR